MTGAMAWRVYSHETEDAVCPARPQQAAILAVPLAGSTAHREGFRRLMFETLSERLGAILDKLTRKGTLTEADVAEAMREVRRALLEADVALDVVRDFTDAVKEKAVGQEVVRSTTPGQMVIKIVHDELVRVARVPTPQASTSPPRRRW